MYICFFSLILTRMITLPLQEQGRVVHVVWMALNDFALAGCNEHLLISDARDHTMVRVRVVGLVGDDDNNFLVDREVPGIVNLKLATSKPARGIRFVQFISNKRKILH